MLIPGAPSLDSPSAWITRSRCHAGCQEVSRCRTRGESEDSFADRHASKGIHPGFETQGSHHQRSKIEVSPAKQKGLISSNCFLKIQLILYFLMNGGSVA